MVAQSNIAVELAKLEADTGQISLIDEKLKAFNVFEVLGVQRRELQHSNFLAYLLNPSERHGFGAKFLKAFFEAALRLANREQTRITMAQVNRLAQSQSCLVVREWDRNDIRIRDPRSRLVCVIENKIGASESDGQLSKYRRGIERQFKSYSSLFVYLTPDREDPTDDRWVRLGYHDIGEALETVLRGGRKRLNSAPYSTVEQYVQTIRRHVVKDEELAQRARDFYEKHQQVLDFILENRPSYAQSLHEQLRREIGRNSKLRLDDESSQYFRFRPRSGITLPA